MVEGGRREGDHQSLRPLLLLLLLLHLFLFLLLLLSLSSPSRCARVYGRFSLFLFLLARSLYSYLPAPFPSALFHRPRALRIPRQPLVHPLLSPLPPFPFPFVSVRRSRYPLAALPSLSASFILTRRVVSPVVSLCVCLASSFPSFIPSYPSLRSRFLLVVSLTRFFIPFPLPSRAPLSPLPPPLSLSLSLLSSFLRFWSRPSLASSASPQHPLSPLEFCLPPTVAAIS